MKGVISRAEKKIDSPEKSGGYAQYIADLSFKGMLYGKTLRSTKARAKIKSIDIPEMSEGCCIVDKSDIPGKNQVRMISYDQPFLAEDTVNYVGEPILLVVGPDKEQVLKILSEIDVSYEEIDPILTIEEAESARTEPLFGKDNCFAEYEINRGDPGEAFRSADTVYEREYRTGYQEHIYLEPQGVVGVYEKNRIAVYGSLQCPYYVKSALVHGLGWDEDRIRVVQTTTGGAFGGKEDYPSIIAGHAAFAALKSGKPVQIVFDRNEDIQCTTKRHPSQIRIKTALDGKGVIKAMDVDIRLDGGAYAGLSSVVLQRAMFAATGVYSVPNIRVRGRVFATNNVPTGAFRGFGSPQAFFAVEMHMQGTAERTGSDPLEFKRKHLLKKGDLTVTGGMLRHDVKMPQMIAEIIKMSGYRKKHRSFRKNGGRVLRGIGLSLFYHGCAFTGSGEKDKIKARVILKRRADGKVEIFVSNVDMGQGPLTTLRKIVARTLEMKLENVAYENPDTDRVPDSGPTVASRTVMIVGFLLDQAARELKAKWDTGSELEVTKRYEEPEYTRWNQETFEGDAYPVYSWGANVVEVEVDPLSCEIRVRGIWGVYDVGTAIDERIVRGQIEGGITQGLGYATLEVMNLKGGRIMQATMTDYVIPTSLDFPVIESRLIDNPYEYGPYGAKCAGELPFVGAAPALASAVQNALGVPIDSIPVTPEHLLEVVEDAH
jgi:CO/xanthine dehydrogenase Mo-binding subunit